MKKPIDVKVTQDGFDKFKAEIARLEERRPGVVSRMSVARDQGDLSENAGYHAAKEELGNIDRRLRELKIMVRFADIVEDAGTGIVGLGSHVVVEDGTGSREFRIVGITEADPTQNLMSDASPIGKALIGAKAGDKITVATPGGPVNFKVISVKSN